MTTSVPQRGRTYPIRLITEARRLHVAGFTDTQIIGLFERRGVDPLPSKTTVGKWVKPARAEAARGDQTRWNAVRAQQRGRLPLGRGHERPEYKLARAIELRQRGLTFAGIAVVMTFDFGDPFSEHQWRYAIGRGQIPRPYRSREAA